MKKAFLWLPAFVLAAFSAYAQPRLAYELRFEQPHTHYVEVQMTISNLDETETEVHLPVWTPGSYLIREFARNVDSFRAAAAGKNLPTQKTSKTSWLIKHGGAKQLQINYRVYAFELSVRTSFIDAAHAYLNGTTVFMYHKKAMNEPHEVRFIPHSSWKRISTTLPQPGDDPWLRLAPNYDELVDCPVEIGNHDEFEFMAAGALHKVAMYGAGKYDEKQLKKDYTKIIETSVAVFGELPLKEYLFIVHHTMLGGGGLEHASSTTLQTRPSVYESESSYKGFLGLVAHEYFHLWNVKRLRPIALGPFDYSKENYTHNLWFSEGFTSYYDNLLNRRAGLMKEADYLEVLRSGVESIHGNPGDAIQSLAESSWDAWIKYYLRNENSSNITVTYYRKGAMLGLVFDLAILQASGGAFGLDSLMKKMYLQYYKGMNRGFSDEELLHACREFMGAEADFIFQNYIYGTEKVDFNRYLAYAGLALEDVRDPKAAYLGVGSRSSSNRLMITSIRSNSAAEKAGLNVNDLILSVDGEEITDLDKWLKAKKPGESFIFIVYRDGKQLKLEGKLDSLPAPRYSWTKKGKRNQVQQKIYDQIVGKD